MDQIAEQKRGPASYDPLSRTSSRGGVISRSDKHQYRVGNWTAALAPISTERRPGPDSYIIRKLEPKGQSRQSYRSTSLGQLPCAGIDKIYNIRESQRKMQRSGTIPVQLYSHARETLPLGDSAPAPTEYDPDPLRVKSRAPSFGFAKQKRLTDIPLQPDALPNPLTYEITDERIIGYTKPVKLPKKPPTKMVAFGTVVETYGVKRTQTAAERRRDKMLDAIV